uniref:Uncharacterized protein n=1 Tax=Avena sativa TaxID=4498 RepID=A0ACD5ZEC0_AVESA
MGSIKGLKGVIICVLILGVVLEQVQVEGKICCMISAGQVCYELCRILGGAPQTVCTISCGCKDTSGNSCSGLFPHPYAHSGADKPNAIEFCSMGCRSSVCDNVNNVYRGEEKAIDVGLCGSACNSFCNKIAVRASVAA